MSARSSATIPKARPSTNSLSSGKLGKKSGQGFYSWKDGKPVKGELATTKSALERLGRELVEPLIKEAQRALDEKVVETADLVDAGVIFGTGFAPFRSGPLHFKASEGKVAAIPQRQAAE